MKVFASICLFLFVALASCAAVAFDEEKFNLDARDVQESNAKFVPATLPDGRKSISVYNGDVLEGSIVEEADGGASVYDAYGHQLNPADLDDDDDDKDGKDGKRDLERRVSKLTILRKFWKFIQKYGKRAWNFLYCISFEVALKCADDILNCAMQGQAPWQCLEGMICGGKAFRTCV